MADETEPTEPPPVKDRLEYVTGEEFSFSPVSLVGSHFHRLENDEMVWQGTVVAEVQAGKYLLHVKRLSGAKDVQVLMTIDQLAYTDEGYEFRFYDSEEKANQAFVEWALPRGERA
jgi:hypothetical protein